MTIYSKVCSSIDKVRPLVGILIGVGRMAMGVANFVLAMNVDKFVFTLPIIFLLHFAFMCFCTCGMFV